MSYLYDICQLKLHKRIFYQSEGNHHIILWYVTIDSMVKCSNHIMKMSLWPTNSSNRLVIDDLVIQYERSRTNLDACPVWSLVSRHTIPSYDSHIKYYFLLLSCDLPLYWEISPRHAKPRLTMKRVLHRSFLRIATIAVFVKCNSHKLQEAIQPKKYAHILHIVMSCCGFLLLIL